MNFCFNSNNPSLNSIEAAKPIASGKTAKKSVKGPKKQPKIEPPLVDPSVPTDLGTIDLTLSNRELWHKFNSHTTEMIITKQGRRMFPTLQYELRGLEANRQYEVFIDLALAEETAWKFQAGKWVACGASQQTQSAKASGHSVYFHPESPNTGAFWMKSEIIFSKLKLTNNKVSPDGHCLLSSMHKYVPRIHIRAVGCESASVSER